MKYAAEEQTQQDVITGVETNAAATGVVIGTGLTTRAGVTKNHVLP